MRFGLEDKKEEVGLDSSNTVVANRNILRRRNFLRRRKLLSLPYTEKMGE